MKDFDKFIREFQELNYFADETMTESQLASFGKFAIDRGILKTIGVGVISTLIGTILTRLIDIQFQKKELQRRLKRQSDNKDVKDKLSLLNKNEEELKKELKDSEIKLKRTEQAINAVKNPFLKKQLKKTVQDEKEKLRIIKTQLNKSSDG